MRSSLAEKDNKALLQRIESLIMRIASLEKIVEIKNSVSEPIWTFDVSRDKYGRLKEITAHKSGDKRVLM